MQSLKKSQVIIISLVLILIFFLVFYPHFDYPFPCHIDEWFHINKAIDLKNNAYVLEFSSIELGFHIFLAFLSTFLNIALFYQFLPAIWAIFSAIILFFIVRQKTENLENSFFIAIFAMFFFASIKSNVNILGLWFFTPLTFSIPFIYLYIHFFTQGIEKQNKKYILISLIIMVLLLFTHGPSLLFSFPMLIIYCLFNYKYIIKQWKFFSIFLILPIIGVIFYSKLIHQSLINSFFNLISLIQFKLGWGIIEMNNSPFEVYSLIGYILAIIGFIFLFSSKKTRKQYLIYLLWPIILIISILIFKTTGVSYFSPYQRNLYYLAISLPILSSLGLYKVLRFIKKITSEKKYKIIKIIILVIVISLALASYFSIPSGIRLYKTVEYQDYKALKSLSNFPKSKVIAPVKISYGIYSISSQEPVFNSYFDTGNKKDVLEFFRYETEIKNNLTFINQSSCETKNQIIKKHNITYVLSQREINCTWESIYNDEDFIYKVNPMIN